MTLKLKPILLAKKDDGLSRLLHACFVLFAQEIEAPLLCQNISDIKGYIEDGIWPIIFLQDDEELGLDGYLLYEVLKNTPGYEFLYYVFISETDTRKYHDSYHMLGSRFYLDKPFVPSQGKNVISFFKDHVDDPYTRVAQQAALRRFQNDNIGAVFFIKKLLSHPIYGLNAELLLMRNEFFNGGRTLTEAKVVEKRLIELLKTSPNTLLILSELSIFYKNMGCIHENLTIYRKMVQMDPRITLKVWEHLSLSLDLDDFDEFIHIFQRLLKNPVFKKTARQYLEKISHVFLPLE